MPKYALTLILIAVTSYASGQCTVNQCTEKCSAGHHLWPILVCDCLPHGNDKVLPPDCALVRVPDQKEQNGYAIIKDVNGASHFLLVPTFKPKLVGIEAHELVNGDLPNYFAEAWAFMANKRKDLPRDSISLAVNSADNRSEDVFHIHIDCIRRDVKDALRKLPLTESKSWTELTLQNPKYGERKYKIKWVPGEVLAEDPIKLVAAGNGGRSMASHSVVVVGARSGFFILDTAGPDRSGRGAHGEDLQCHKNCP